MPRYDQLPTNDSTGTPDDQTELLFEARPSLDPDETRNSTDPQNANAHLNSSSSSSAAPASSVRPSPVIRGNDGVFSNMSAKPEASAATPGKAYLDAIQSEPPSYADIVQEPAPSYYETTVIASSIGQDGEVLIEGMPVGDFFTFFVNLLVSMSFDFIGFLLTALLATSHAARAGARAGFGITLIRYGAYLQTRSLDDDMYKYYEPYDPDSPTPQDEEIAAENTWLSYLLMAIGFFILLRANADYVNARRMQAVIQASSEVSPV